MNFQIFKLDVEKADEPDIKLPISFGSSKRQKNIRKNLLCFINYSKAFAYVDHHKLWKIL